VRNAAGLGNYILATDDASLLEEVLRQRRYALFGEGHRWIDLRRTNRLGDLPLDRVGDVVHPGLPRPPASELARLADL
ncbi:MAG: RagB/SusD family nutrient uptake outer membrane protein, partial [Myxococcota bacterium]